MSCRTTKGGTLALRMARRYSGLPDQQAQRLFHALTREGRGLPPPGEELMKLWRERQRALMEHADLTERERERCERDLFTAYGENVGGDVFHAWSRIEVRSRQEAVLAQISNAVDLDPPGSHFDSYEWGPDGRPARVWYASYGSNLNRDRFLAYIRGGSPEGSSVRQPGARDRSEPAGDIPIRFDGRMHFAHSSGRWGSGGVAFMDVDHAGHALGRAYLITSEQFDDVVAQENGRSPSAAHSVPMSRVLLEQRDVVSQSSLYGTVLHVGDYQGAPVLTFTGSFTARDALLEASGATEPSGQAALWSAAANSPHGNYLRMVASGLEDTFGMTKAQQADYLRGCGGAEGWARRELLAVLRADAPIGPPASARPVPVRPVPSVFRPPTDYPGYRSGAEPPPWREWGSPGRAGARKTCPACGGFHSLHDCRSLRAFDPDAPPLPASARRKRKKKRRPGRQDRPNVT